MLTAVVEVMATVPSVAVAAIVLGCNSGSNNRRGRRHYPATATATNNDFAITGKPPLQARYNVMNLLIQFPNTNTATVYH